MHQYKELADNGAGKYEQRHDQPCLSLCIGEGVVITDHQQNDGKREVGIVDRALFTALAINRIGLLARLHGIDHAALARNDPEENVRGHGCRHDSTGQKERSTASKQLSAYIGNYDKQHPNRNTQDAVPLHVRAYALAQLIVYNPPEYQEKHRRNVGLPST